MFNDASNLVFSFSLTGSKVANTDYPLIKGLTNHSHKITMVAGEVLTIDFDQLSGHECISFYVYKPASTSTLTFEIFGDTYTVEKNGWNRIIINNSSNISQLIFNSSANISFFLDKLGGRLTRYEMDEDIRDQFADQISIITTTQTTLSADLSGRSISLTSRQGFTENSTIKIGNDILKLVNFETLKEASPNPHLSGETVYLIVPTETEVDKELPNPSIAISIYDNSGRKLRGTVNGNNGQINGVRMAKVGIAVSVIGRKFFHSIKRQYEEKYGDEFFLYIDGEKTQIVSESDTMGLENDGNKSHIYFYRVSPPVFRDVQYFDTPTKETIIQTAGVL